MNSYKVNINELNSFEDIIKKIDSFGVGFIAVVDDLENVISRKNSAEDPIACGIMFRRNAIDDVGLMDEEFHLNEEKEYRNRFEKQFVIDHLCIPLYRYRRHEGNITNDLEKMKFYDDMLSQQK